MNACPHKHVILQSTGRRRFIDGEVDDNIREYYLCVDCWEELMEEPEHLEERRLGILENPKWQEMKKELPQAVAKHLDTMLRDGVGDSDIFIAQLAIDTANKEPGKRIYTYQQILANGNPKYPNELLGLVLDDVETFLETGSLP